VQLPKRAAAESVKRLASLLVRLHAPWETKSAQMKKITRTEGQEGGTSLNGRGIFISRLCLKND